jgi:tRNA(Ile2) C34 agmatinyltransferase TiaS
MAREILKEKTLSEKTSIAVLEGISIPKALREYAERAKKSMITVEEAESVAQEVGVELIEVTGSHGKIGALAALGLYDDVDEAVKVYY